MQCGFTEAEVHDMWDVVAPDTLDYFGWEHPLDMWVTTLDWETGGNAAIAATDFNIDPAIHWDQNNWSDVAQRVKFNDFYLPYLFEDELLGTMLHELAHVVGPLSDQHNDAWRQRCYEIGGPPVELMIIRNWRLLPDGVGRKMEKFCSGMEIFFQKQTAIEGFMDRVGNNTLDHFNIKE